MGPFFFMEASRAISTARRTPMQNPAFLANLTRAIVQGLPLRKKLNGMNGPILCSRDFSQSRILLRLSSNLKLIGITAGCQYAWLSCPPSLSRNQIKVDSLEAVPGPGARP